MPSATNALSMAETCLASKPTTLFTLKAQLTTKPTAKLPNLPIVSSFPLRLSLRNKSFSRIVPLVAETTKWESGDAEEAKLYVGNLPFDVDRERLATLFGEAGVVEIAEVIYDRETDKSRGFGFVTMSSVEEAEKAIELFHSYDLDGLLLAVNKAALSESIEESVKNLASQDKVVDAKVINLENLQPLLISGGTQKMIIKAAEAKQDDAIAAVDGQSLDGRAIRVKVAKQRPAELIFIFLNSAIQWLRIFRREIFNV